MSTEENTCGLPREVFKACKFLGLTFPPEPLKNPQPTPSDYFGDDFALDDAAIKKICSARKWTRARFNEEYASFSEKFAIQKPLKQNKTDLNVWFCDWALFAGKDLGASSTDYFDFEFYNKSDEIRRSFRTQRHRDMTLRLCNDRTAGWLLKNKAKANELFAPFLHREWINAAKCTFEDFGLFVEKNPRFFAKPIAGLQGEGAEVVNVTAETNLETLFGKLKRQKKLLEEVISQHETLREFCPDTVNTIRINTLLDEHNVVHILTAVGRFGRVGGVTDNFTGGGFSCAIDPKSGVIISDGISRAHERIQSHPDTGKVFKGFQYPCWDKVRATVRTMARMLPRLRHVGWDVTVNDKEEIVLVEANDAPGVGVQQAAGGVGKLNIYDPILKEIRDYKRANMSLLGYRVNAFSNVETAYNTPSRKAARLQFALGKLVPDCASLIDVGCRKDKLVKGLCPEGVKYFPVDYKKHDAEVTVCNFNAGEFPDIKADACLCAFTAEYVETLPKFLRNMCNAAQKQVLMWCRPVDKETNAPYRWKNPFVTDFTEEFLLKVMEQNGFELTAAYPAPENKSAILYDFKRVAPPKAQPAPKVPAKKKKNPYGLSEGVFKACKLLGLTFPPEPVDKPQPVPSDYFGDDVELSEDVIEKICSAREWTKTRLMKEYQAFSEKFAIQKPLRQTKTDLNVFFCDYAFHAKKAYGSSEKDYFDFEFYNKPADLRRKFRTQRNRLLARAVFNDPSDIALLDQKVQTNTLFAPFIHRDWINTTTCTFKEFEDFVGRHPRFFSKPIKASLGRGAQILSVSPNENLEKLFADLKDKESLLEEVVKQHEALNAFCPDTLNTIRVNTVLDVHNVVHILTATGRFGRMGEVIDNFSGGGYSVIIDSATGIVTSDALDKRHELITEHLDTHKVFKGFQYPCWNKVREAVTKMARLIPQLRHIGWDIGINDKGDAVLVEANGNPDVHVQQSPDDLGRVHIYTPLIKEIRQYRHEQIRLLGYRINTLSDVVNFYENEPFRLKANIAYAMNKFIPDCASVMDLGCRRRKLVKALCPKGVKYFPVDYVKHDAEVIACNFDEGEFPNVKVDTCVCAFTAEYVEALPQFLDNMCNAARKQILMWSRPIDKNFQISYRWEHPLVADFTEEFLIKTMEQNGFELTEAYPAPENKSAILYDFRRVVPLDDAQPAEVSTVDEIPQPAEVSTVDEIPQPAEVTTVDEIPQPAEVPTVDEIPQPAEVTTPDEIPQLAEIATPDENTYGLVPEIYKACLFLNLKFPPDALRKTKLVPSDYFGDDFEFDGAMIRKICSARKWTQERFDEEYKVFSEKFSTQKPLKQTKTDLNIFFCDYVLFAQKIFGANALNYFDFEFYNKPADLRRKFRTHKLRDKDLTLCNEFTAGVLLRNKAKANEIFANFLHRDWINVADCTFEDFKLFVTNHPRFFAKLIDGSKGEGAEIVNVTAETNLETLFDELKNQQKILEELIFQHKALQDFCPDTVNTIRLETLLDAHNVVHILTAAGRFGRVGGVTDNFSGGGFSCSIDPKTGVIISDGISRAHERIQSHLDTGKVFKGFQYPCWNKICATVKRMAKLIPQLRYVGWDITVSDKEEIVLVEANGTPGVGVQQAAADDGKLHIYAPIIDELEDYEEERMRRLGYRVNNLPNAVSAYYTPSRKKPRLAYAMSKLIPDCASVMDVGCRKNKLVKGLCPKGVKYFPVDYKKYDAKVIACDFNAGEFPNVKVDTCVCAFTAEYVEALPQFLGNMCNAAQKQILIYCRPIDKERHLSYRWEHPVLTDFTEEFLLKTMEQNGFKVTAQYPSAKNAGIILYDFRRFATPQIQPAPEVPAPTQENQNPYGLSEGVFKACQFLGLEFPPEPVDKPQPVPSDYFGDDVELDDAAIKKICAARNWTQKVFRDTYKIFSNKFSAQKPLKQTKTDLNIFFCDFALFDEKDLGASSVDYFAYEYHNKPFALRGTFRTEGHRSLTLTICNTSSDKWTLRNKARTNKFFAPFVRRDWINTTNCTFEDFKRFVEKHPRFFSKLLDSSLGKGAKIINVSPNENLEKLFANLKADRRLLEEVITQHEDLSAFCPDTLNTIRVNTVLDVHNVVHILTATGRFGRVGKVIDNFSGGGYSVIIDPKTGIITSDAINKVHDIIAEHPDTHKVFKGFQYPCWNKVREVVKRMARMIPQMRHVGWDIAVNDKGEAVLVEANSHPDVDLQQAADGVGRLPLYTPLLEEMENYKREQMRLLGYRVNNLSNFDDEYFTQSRRTPRLELMMKKLIPNCTSLIDVGCRRRKLVKGLCPKGVKYFPVDYKKYDAEIMACNFNAGEFPKFNVDACICAFTAEYVEALPQFLNNMCNAARKQVLIWCRPVDKELFPRYRWEHPLLTDFTEEFLINSVEKNGFKLNAAYPSPDNNAIILYDFRRVVPLATDLPTPDIPALTKAVALKKVATPAPQKRPPKDGLYGLSEGVFRACQFLGLKFPSKPVNKAQPVPSDYFGDNVRLNEAAIKKICAARNWTRKVFRDEYKSFSNKFSMQKPLKKTKTDLNVWFCDYVLFVKKELGASPDNYFDMEFYTKSFASRREFVTLSVRNRVVAFCNDRSYMRLVNNKVKTNNLFAEFLHRDWLYTDECTFEKFADFVKKHPRFFSKLSAGAGGVGAQIIKVSSNTSLKNLFADLKSKRRIVEEIVVQHEDLQAFCPDTVNTIRIYTILDVHDNVHILSAVGRFGRVGGVVDNFHGGGQSVAIDLATGIITSDGINRYHERVQKHPDTGKVFKGFQYPCWDKVRATVTEMAKILPQLRYIAWDIAVNDKAEIVLIEANGSAPDINLQQAADGVGRLHLYTPLEEEMENYKREQMRLLGYRVNNLRDFNAEYYTQSRRKPRLEMMMKKLIPNCTSVMDLGCRRRKLVKGLCPAGIKYFPVDYKKYDAEITACDFNAGEFPDKKVDTCVCAFTAEYVSALPQFLNNMCNAAQKQILMWGRPVDRELFPRYRWEHPALTDFTEEFLINSVEKNGFRLIGRYPSPNNNGIILYDFRRIRT